MLASALALGGCAIEYPPVATPHALIPDVADVPTPAPNQGLLVLDANGEDARITADGSTICATTPCAVALDKGSHRLTFFSSHDAARYGDVTVDVSASPRVVRHSLGVRRESPGLRGAGIATIAVGTSLAGLGLATAGLGLLDENHRSVWTTSGGAMAATGLIGVALGVSFALAARTAIWPAATRTWLLTPPR